MGISEGTLAHPPGRDAEKRNDMAFCNNVCFADVFEYDHSWCVFDIFWHLTTGFNRKNMFLERTVSGANRFLTLPPCKSAYRIARV